MIVEILNTGSELLLGEVINTHAAWLGGELFPLGLRITRQVTVPDGPLIRRALIETFDRADIVIVTGGLGPTTDDITREATAELLGLKLLPDEAIRAAIAARLSARGYAFRERMARQVMVPEGAVVLPNEHGTAPGLYIEAISRPSSKSPHFFLLPGPPRELRPMFTRYALPILRGLCGDLPARECRTYRVVGLGESEIEERVGLILTRGGDVEVGYCARPNEVDLRLIAARDVLDRVEPIVLAAVGDSLVSRSGEALEEWVVAHLAAAGLSLTTAESCSGGFLAHRITNVPGSSGVFRMGFVTYANEAKGEFLHIASDLLARFGAVSEPVACAMAEGALHRAQADYALALTGVAGPGGGTEAKPVGTVFVALASRGHATICRECHFPSDRATFKQLATQAALDLLRRALLARERSLTAGVAVGH